MFNQYCYYYLEPEQVQEAPKLVGKVISQVELVEIAVHETAVAEKVETPVQKPLYSEPLSLETGEMEIMLIFLSLTKNYHLKM